MKALLNKLLFKRHSRIPDSGDSRNPWLKEGEYVYLHSRKGRYEVVSVRENGFYVIKEHQARNHTPEFHSWSDFKRWSGKSSVKNG